MAMSKLAGEIFKKVLDAFAFYSEKDFPKCGGTSCNLNEGEFCHESLADECHPCSEQCGPTRELSPSSFCLEKCLWYIKKGELIEFYNQYTEPGYELITAPLTTSVPHNDDSSQTMWFITAVVVLSIIVVLLMAVIVFCYKKIKELKAELAQATSQTNQMECVAIDMRSERDQQDQLATTQLLTDSQRTSGYTTSSSTPETHYPAGGPLREHPQITRPNSIQPRSDQPASAVSSGELNQALNRLPQQCQTPAEDERATGSANSLSLALESSTNHAPVSDRRPIESTITRETMHQPESTPMNVLRGHEPRYPHYPVPETTAHTN